MIPISKYVKIDELSNLPKEKFRIIDVRSPAEFEEDHILGSENFPVLDDHERKNVGILYKQDTFEAKRLGARIISTNISKILEKIENTEINYKQMGLRKPDTSFLIYCWRGGMRSTSLFTVMDLIGYKSYVLDGGYKSYRNWVNNYISKYSFPDLYVIHGPSGTGKTKILKLLKKEGFPILNLEEIANHNGSVFGSLSRNQPSQKLFESILVENLKKLKSSPLIILEGESRKIGKNSLPNHLYNSIQSAKKIWIELPLKERAEALSQEYKFSESEFLEKLNYIKKYMKSDVIIKIKNCFNNGDYFETAHLLLKYHYDNLYFKSFKYSNHEMDYHINENSFEQLYEKLRNYIKGLI